MAAEKAARTRVAATARKCGVASRRIPFFMPKPATLRRRAQRRRAKSRRFTHATFPLWQAGNILKDVYLPALTKMFERDSVLLHRLNRREEASFSGHYYVTLPFSLRPAD